MYRSLLIFCAILLLSDCVAQDLTDSRTTSFYTYFYSISDNQALRIARKGTINSEEDLFYSKVDSFATGIDYQWTLKPGNYLKAFIDKDKIDLEYFCIPNIHVSIVENQTDLILQLRNLTGETVTDALMRIGGRRIPFDEKTGSYRLKKANCRGILSVGHDGMTSLIRLERSFNNPGIKRASRKIAYGSPVKYVWVPVRTTVMLPVDAVISAIRGYGFYTARGVWQRISRAFSEGRPSAGYIVFNKPKYNPGDTVMLKAFILQGKNHLPLKREADIKITKSDPYERIKLGTVAPYTPGGFSYSFVLDDSLGLQLDKDYTVSVSKAGKYNTLLTGDFRYEYYDLKGLRLNLLLPEKVHYKGIPFFAGLKAVNENEMVLPDARVTLVILCDKVSEIFGKQITVRDTLSVIRESLQASGETLIAIPDSVFPDANLSYTLVATANTSDNETVTVTEKITFLSRKEEIEFTTLGDIVNFLLKVDGKETVGGGTLTTEDAFGNKKGVAVNFPFSLMTDPFVAAYTLTSGGTSRTIRATEISPEIVCNTQLINDSVFINARSSTGLNFVYFIYELNREVQRGITDSLNFRHRASGNKNWYLSLNYLWGGEMNNSMYQIVEQKDKLTISVDQPAMIIPGNKATVTIQVNDFEGKPVSGADLTAYAITRKFEATLPSLPSLAKSSRRKELINRFNANTATDTDLWYRFRYDSWKKDAGLDTIEYFRFRFHPEEVCTFLSDMGDSITQFAPFIFKKGYPVNINHIYIDHRPVYIDIASDNQPYSFRVDSGYHFISIRTPHSIYEIDSLRFIEGKKLILSINDTDNPESFQRKEAKPKLTKAEAARLQNYLMPYRSSFNNSVAYISQADNLLLMSDLSRQISDPHLNSSGYGYELAGPVMPAKARFVSDVKFQTDFNFEPLYEYDFAPGLLKMKSFERVKWLPARLSLYSATKDLKNSVITREYLDSMRLEILKARTRTAYYYEKNVATQRGNGSVEILNLKRETGEQPVAIILYSESRRTVDTRRGYENSFTNMIPGQYTLLAFYDEGEFCRADSVIVSTDSRTFIDFKEAVPERDRDQFNRVLELINLTGGNQRQLASERQLLQVFTRQDASPYSGPGYTVTGRVISSDDGEPLPGVTVICNILEIGVITDIDGNYSLRLPFGVNTVTFSFIGMKNQEYVLSYDQTLDVSLESDLMALDEVVVIGYGISRKSSVTASTITVTNSLEGSLAGVFVTDGSSISIRGVSSMTAGMPPLIIIDGKPFTGNIADLDPELIRNIKIIKDPSMTAIYGSRASGGVIMLTTGPGGFLTAAPDKGVTFDDTFMEQAMASGTLRKNFRDYAFWQPKLQTNDSGRVSFTASFPDDITSWETFVIGMTGKRQTGSATGLIKAFRPVIAQLTAPRYFTAGDSVNLIGKIVNYTSASTALTERFICNSDTVFAIAKKLKDAIIDTIPVTTGDADSLRMEFSFVTESGLKDGEYRPIPVNRAGMEIDSGSFMILERDTTVTFDLDAFAGEVTLNAMAGALDVLMDNSYRLIRYYYTCNEQMASKLIGLLSAETVKKALGTEKQSDRREANKLIKQLNENRNDQGLWGWWGRSGTEQWISLHVLDALMMAKEQGYKVEPYATYFIDDAIIMLESDSPALLKLSLLDLLTKTGASVDYNHYLTLIDKSYNLSFTDSLRIVSLRQKHLLPVDLSFLRKAQRSTIYGGVYFTSGEAERSITGNDTGTTLLVYGILSADSTQTITDLSRVRNFFLESLTFGKGMNTYQIAGILRTVLKDMTGKTYTGKKPLLTLSGQVSKEIDEFPFDITLPAEGNVTVGWQGLLPLYLSCSQRVFMENPSADTTDFRVTTHWPSSLNEVKSGVPVTLTADVVFYKSADYIVLEIPVPSGFSYISRQSKLPGEDHREFFRDHVAIFLRHADPGQRSFGIELMPRFTGSYVVNPAKVSLMYFPTVYSNNALKRLIIR